MVNEPTRGARIVGLQVWGTVVFTVLAVAALIWRENDPLTVAVVVVSLVLFALGVGMSIWAYAAAVERSRTEQIAVGSLYLLMGGVAPRSVATRLWLCWGVQIVVALLVGIIGSTGLSEGENNPLAFAALVPMFGVGCNGLWAARHGRYAARAPQRRPTR